MALRSDAYMSAAREWPKLPRHARGVPPTLWASRTYALALVFVAPAEGVSDMAKGQQRPKTNNKPKLTVKEKKEKKKEKAARK